MKNILVVSHCILNNAAKVADDGAGLAEEYRQRDEMMQAVLDKNVQLLQLPCPEFIMYGSRRWGHVKDQFDNPFFRSRSRELLKRTLMQLREYASNTNRFRLLGIVSVEGSPSCGYRLSCRADWGGEINETVCEAGGAAAKVRMVNEPGVYMEVLAGMLEESGLELPILTIPEATSTIKTL